MHKFFKASLGLVTGSALVLGATSAASAAPLPQEKPAVSTTVDEQYSDADVVEFLVFGSGDIADNNPEQVEKLGLKSENVTEDVVESATEQILAADPAFHTHVTESVLSGNPYQVREGLTSLSETLEGVAQDQIPGDVSTNCVVWGVINVLVAIELVVAGALVIVVAYRGDDASSRFTQDEVAASLSALS